MFDHTLDNMSFFDEGSESVSELLRKRASSLSMQRSRSRFISDESIFAFRMSHGTSFVQTPDKYELTEVEEYK